MNKIDLNLKIKLVHQALSSDKARVGFLLGAGCSSAIQVDGKSIIPNITDLTKDVYQILDNDVEHSCSFTIIKNKVLARKSNASIEDMLTFIRKLVEIMESDDFFGLRKENVELIEKKICELVSDRVNKSLPTCDGPHNRLAKWIKSIPRAYPVEIFTTNYDLLIEESLEQNAIPFFDGFSGSRYPFFDLTSVDSEQIPAQWTRLWKIHGSINWWSSNGGVVRSMKSPTDTAPLMIYPSHLKYDQSRRLPYLAMIDKLVSFLGKDKEKCINVLVTLGYSFVDEHINGAIIQGLDGNPRNSSAFCMIYGNLEDNAVAVDFAKKRTNVTLLARNGGVINGAECCWKAEDGVDPSFSSVLVGDTDVCESLLGDFNSFGLFLEQYFQGHNGRAS